VTSDRSDGAGSPQAAAGGHVPSPIDRRQGLCHACSHARIIRSDRGSSFLLCGLARTDARFLKYPPQPVVECAGFRR